MMWATLCPALGERYDKINKTNKWIQLQPCKATSNEASGGQERTQNISLWPLVHSEVSHSSNNGAIDLEDTPRAA